MREARLLANGRAVRRAAVMQRTSERRALLSDADQRDLANQSWRRAKVRPEAQHERRAPEIETDLIAACTNGQPISVSAMHRHAAIHTRGRRVLLQLTGKVSQRHLQRRLGRGGTDVQLESLGRKAEVRVERPP